MSKILVFNTGSSSLKFKLFDFNQDKLSLTLVKQGEVEGIGTSGGPKNHRMALDILFEGFGRYEGFLNKIEDLVAIGHRVVHCGDEYDETVEVNENVIKTLEKYSLNAPLHNPKIIEVMRAILVKSGRAGHRNIPNYAVFDSVYFRNLPKVTKIYPLPYYFYQDYKIQRYGFHGISHHATVENVLNKYPGSKKIISLHLGQGSSAAAILDGKPIDTSMGFTPLEGLMMMTRSGDVDAGIIHWLIEKNIIKHPDVDKVLNFESGLRGVSGLECGMKDLLNIAGYQVEDPNFEPNIDPVSVEPLSLQRIKLSIEMYVYRIVKYIGSYYAILGGLDVLAFSGKIGAGSSEIRKLVIGKTRHILTNAKIAIISPDEELQIAKEIIPLIK